MKSPKRQLTLSAFMQAQNCTHYAASWRHPAMAGDFLTPEYYQRMARVLEEGKFHMAFFDDRLAMPDRHGNSHAETVRSGVRPVKLDPMPVLAVMGMATKHLGLGATYSTTYHDPYHVARTFQTLDQMIGGRAAWNVVTSQNDSEAANFGRDKHMEHGLRYDRADEFLEVVVGHWKSWDRDAIILDKEAGVFADPDKVRRLDYVGKYMKSRGPFTVPQSPQGHPVIIQAGQSGRGMDFAARWGEVVFAYYPNIEAGKKGYAEVKRRISALGRDAEATKIMTAINVIVGETQAIAEEKLELLDSLAKPIDTLILLSESMDFDFSVKSLDDTFSDEEIKSMNAVVSMRDRVIAMSGKANPTVRDFIKYTNRSTIREFPLFAGTPQAIADKFEEWLFGEACDGFVINAAYAPGGFEDMVRLLIPELQKRGIFRKEYTGTTLRDNLGLPRP